MAFAPAESLAGLVSFTNIDTSANRVIPVGTIVRGIDTASTKTAGEFIYLPGVASNIVGAVVTYNPLAPSVALVPNTANLGQPVAVSMAANTTTTSYSWYQLEGVATIKKTAVVVNPNVRVYISATAGRIMSTSVAGKSIVNARSVNAASVVSATSSVAILINRPFAQGVIT